MPDTAHTPTKPARIFATVNGEVASYPAGTRHLIGGWSTGSDSSRASEYVRGDIADAMLAALKAISRHIDSPANFDKHINDLCDAAISAATPKEG